MLRNLENYVCETSPIYGVVFHLVDLELNASHNAVPERFLQEGHGYDYVVLFYNYER